MSIVFVRDVCWILSFMMPVESWHRNMNIRKSIKDANRCHLLRSRINIKKSNIKKEQSSGQWVNYRVPYLAHCIFSPPIVFYHPYLSFPKTCNVNKNRGRTKDIASGQVPENPFPQHSDSLMSICTDVLELPGYPDQKLGNMPSWYTKWYCL